MATFDYSSIVRSITAAKTGDEECEECGGTVDGSYFYDADEWPVCKSCWADLSDEMKDEIIAQLPALETDQ